MQTPTFHIVGIVGSVTLFHSVERQMLAWPASSGVVLSTSCVIVVVVARSVVLFFPFASRALFAVFHETDRECEFSRKGKEQLACDRASAHWIVHIVLNFKIAAGLFLQRKHRIGFKVFIRARRRSGKIRLIY